MPSTILLFALAREKAGAQTLAVELPPNPTVGDLKTALALACPALAPLLSTLRFAVNSEYALDDQQPIPSQLRTGGHPARQRRLETDRRRTMIEITSDPIDHATVTERVRSHQAGRFVCVRSSARSAR